MTTKVPTYEEPVVMNGTRVAVLLAGGNGTPLGSTASFDLAHEVITWKIELVTEGLSDPDQLARLRVTTRSGFSLTQPYPALRLVRGLTEAAATMAGIAAKAKPSGE